MHNLNIAVDNFHVFIFIRTWLIHCSFGHALSWIWYSSKQKNNWKDNSVHSMSAIAIENGIKIRFKTRVLFKPNHRQHKHRVQMLLWKALRVIKKKEKTVYLLPSIFVELWVWFGCLPRFPLLFIIYLIHSSLRITHTAFCTLNNIGFPLGWDCGQRGVHLRYFSWGL